MNMRCFACYDALTDEQREHPIGRAMKATAIQATLRGVPPSRQGLGGNDH